MASKKLSHPPTVLITDDDTDLRETFMLWLGEEWDVREPENGMEALAKLDSEIRESFIRRGGPWNASRFGQ